jgi:hypothetical protein
VHVSTVLNFCGWVDLNVFHMQGNVISQLCQHHCPVLDHVVNIHQRCCCYGKHSGPFVGCFDGSARLRRTESTHVYFSLVPQRNRTCSSLFVPRHSSTTGNYSILLIHKSSVIDQHIRRHTPVTNTSSPRLPATLAF